MFAKTSGWWCSVGSKEPVLFNSDKDSDQTVWIHRLIWVFDRGTGHYVGFVTLRLMSYILYETSRVFFQISVIFLTWWNISRTTISTGRRRRKIPQWTMTLHMKVKVKLTIQKIVTLDQIRTLILIVKIGVEKTHELFIDDYFVEFIQFSAWACRRTVIRSTGCHDDDVMVTVVAQTVIETVRCCCLMWMTLPLTSAVECRIFV